MFAIAAPDALLTVLTTKAVLTAAASATLDATVAIHTIDAVDAVPTTLQGLQGCNGLLQGSPGLDEGKVVVLILNAAIYDLVVLVGHWSHANRGWLFMHRFWFARPLLFQVY